MTQATFDVERRDMASEIRQFARVLVEQWWLIALCGVLAGSVAWAWSASRPHVYETSAKLLLQQSGVQQTLTNLPGIDPNRQTATDVQLVALPKVAEQVRRKLKLDEPGGALLGKVRVSGGGDSNVVSVTVRDSDPARASRLANAFARAYIDFRSNLNRRQVTGAAARIRQRAGRLRRLRGDPGEISRLNAQARQLQLASSLETGDAQLIQPAGVPGVAVQPQPKRDIGLGLMFGVLIGVGLALLRDRLDRRVKSEDDVRAIFPGVPIVAEVPRPGGGAEGKTMAVESFHALRANLDMVRPNGPLHSLLITSAGARDGKSSTAANLALAMQEMHRDALVVEADLRRPALSRAFSVNGGRGTAKVLAGTDRLDEAVKEARVTSQMSGDGPFVVMSGRFALVPAGPVPARPSTLLNEQALESLLSQADQRHETVIVDGPPIGLFSDMLPVAKRVDGVVVVVRLYHSTVDDLRRFAERISEAGIRPLGVVLTGAKADASRYRDY